MLLLICFPILYAVANVGSNEIKRENHYITKRLVADIYEYNNPPSVFSVPVAIVYEEGNRHEKSAKTKVNIPKSVVQDDVTSTEATEITTRKVLKAHFSVSNGPNMKPDIEDELIIPVAILYDDKFKNLPNSKALTKTESRNRQQRNQRSITINASQHDTEEINRVNEDNQYGTKFPKRTQKRDPIVPILQLENYVFSDSGDFHYSYEGGDGTKASMKGELRSLDDDNVGAAVEGSFSYIGKDGNDYSLTYTADENGYRPIGAHLPTPPPIPPAIARALRYLATKTTPQPVTESL